MAEKDLTKKITKVLKDIDKIVQYGEQALKDLKELTDNGKKGDSSE